jgi:hypothetical protein
LTLTQLTPRRLSVIALLAAAGSVALALLVLTPARGDVNLNNNDCHGRIEPGTPEPADDKGVYQVKYTFACSGPITGYSIQLQRGVDSFDTDGLVLNKVTGDSVTTDSFSCNGDIPGLGFNCVGTYSGGWNNITGQFAVTRKLTKKPKISPRLLVATATIASGKPVQALSGPYQLGHPRLGLSKKHKKK